MLHEVYQQIKKDVGTFAKRRHLTIVLNVDTRPASGDKPDDVARSLGNPAVWYDNSIDLTPLLEKHYASRSR